VVVADPADGNARWCCRLCRLHPSALCPTLGAVMGAMAGEDELS
jgi:hypothetical protein